LRVVLSLPVCCCHSLPRPSLVSFPTRRSSDLFQFARTRCLRVRQEANAPESLAAIPHCAASSAGGSISWCVLLLGRIQDSRNSCREPPPPRTLRHQLPLSRFGQVIDTQPWAKLRRLPFRGDPAFALKPVERRI